MFHPQGAECGGLDRRRFVELCAGSLALAAAGCARDTHRTHSRRSTVTVGVPGSGDPNPTPHYDQPLWLAFLPLMAPNAQGELEGRLAERWEHSRDYREWTYHLRPGVRWHDGVPVTAQDIKFTLELMNSPDVMEFLDLEAVTVVDDRTVKVRLPSYFAYQWQEIQYPKHLLEHLDARQFWHWEFWKRPVGNGPYRFVRYEHQTMMEFEANPAWYRDPPRIERVVVKFMGEAGLSDLLAGEVDALSNVNPAWIPILAADPRFRLYHASTTNYAGLYWQHRDPLFQDARVRRALTLAINRRELLELVQFPSDAPLTDGPTTGRELQRGRLEEALPYDPVQARALLEAAGWHPRNEIREREGAAFRFSALVPSRNPIYQKMAIYVQAQLRRVGLDMVVEMREDVVRQIRNGQFQAAFDDASTGHLFHTLNGGDTKDFADSNGLGYRNARVIDLVQASQATPNPENKDRIYAELRAIFREDVPVTYLIPMFRFSVAHRRIRGLSAPWRMDPLRFMDELWLDDQGEG